MYAFWWCNVGKDEPCWLLAILLAIQDEREDENREIVRGRVVESTGN
jgi:hypothetical protein